MLFTRKTLWKSAVGKLVDRNTNRPGKSPTMNQVLSFMFALITKKNPSKI